MEREKDREKQEPDPDSRHDLQNCEAYGFRDLIDGFQRQVRCYKCERKIIEGGMCVVFDSHTLI